MTKGWTFQSLIDARMEVRAFCKQVLDLVKVRDRFGRNGMGHSGLLPVFRTRG
jgi:hypothetical protein